jgi:hypothetical protein
MVLILQDNIAPQPFERAKGLRQTLQDVFRIAVSGYVCLTMKYGGADEENDIFFVRNVICFGWRPSARGKEDYGTQDWQG